MTVMLSQLRRNAVQVSAAVSQEPAIRPSFARAGVFDIIRIMLAVMMNRNFDAAGLYRYLEARGCPFDRDVIEFLLTAYEGEDPEQHLWVRDTLGGYQPLH